MDLMCQGEWTALVVGSDTSRIRDGSYLRRPVYQYNYALRYLLERASRMASSRNEPLTVTIEARRNFDLEESSADTSGCSAVGTILTSSGM